MRHSIGRELARLGVLLLSTLTGCGGGDLTLPVPPDAGDFRISPVGSTDRTGRVGEKLSDGLTVVVVDPGGDPARGYAVAFTLPDGSAAGELSPDTIMTDDRGQAAVTWRLGYRPGSYLAQARLAAPDEADLPVAEFRVSVEAGPPDTVRAVSPLNQPGRRNRELDDPLVVAVVDRYGNPVPRVDVSWAVLSGEGAVSESVVATDDRGQSAVRWTLGNRTGVQKVTATVPGITGSPVVFGAAVLF